MGRPILQIQQMGSSLMSSDKPVRSVTNTGIATTFKQKLAGLYAGAQAWIAKDRFWDKAPSPVAIYYLILVPTLILMGTGLLMVFSATSIEVISEGGNPFLSYKRTVIIMSIGVATLILSSYLPTRVWKILAPVAFVGALGLQSLIFLPSFAHSEGGNTNWVTLPLVGTFQPSETIKLGLTLVLGYVLATKLKANRDLKQIAIYVGGPAAASLALILAGEDLGTALIIGVLILGIALVAVMPARFYATFAAVALVGLLVLVAWKPSRLARLLNFTPFFKQRDVLNPDQVDHSLWALGSGGWTGVGPGASKEKWNYLAAAHTDFIYAVVGEEFGLFGTLGILCVFVTLFYGMYWLAVSQTSIFKRVVVAGTLTWMGAQTFINMAMVTGAGPVVGVPLPFISHGGTSFILTALSVGIVLGIAREEAGIKRIFGLHGVFRRRLS